MFSQELLTNGELNHFSLKERMVEIGKRWHKLSPTQKDKYKKLVEEQQVEYKVELEAWVKVSLCRAPPPPHPPPTGSTQLLIGLTRSRLVSSRLSRCPRRTEPPTRSSPPR